MHTPERLTPCPSCACFVRADETTCPHCGARSTARNGLLSTAAAALMVGLATTACVNGDDVGDAVALYGVPDTSVYEDADNDGYDTSEDCNDDDASIHPGAEETAGDGVDSNCNDEDDT